MKPIYSTIPVGLIKYALVKRKVNHLKLLVYFKHISSGHIKYNNNYIQAWATDLCVSERWVKNALKWLIKNGWLTVNTKRESYRLTSYEQICRKLYIQSNSCAIYEPDDFSSFRSFCCAVIITYYLKLKNLIHKKSQSVSILADPSWSWYFYSRGFYTMPISYLAKCLGVSNSTANNIKKCAIKTGAIEVKKNHPIITSNGKKLGIEHFHAYKQAFPKIAGRIRTDGRYLRLVESDLIKSEIITKQKRYKY